MSITKRCEPDVAERPQFTVLFDFKEELWRSMDLNGEMLSQHLASTCGANVLCVRPVFRRRFSAVPAWGRTRVAWNADRLVNRQIDYAFAARRLAQRPGFFHVVDHSYAHLVHSLPPSLTGVYCHDIDAFRCLVDPRVRRPLWFRAMAKRILSGLQRAAVVFYSSCAVRRELETFRLVDPQRLVQAPPGVSPDYRWPLPEGSELPPELQGRPFLLNVASASPRKRLDVLVDSFAAVARVRPEMMLVQVGAGEGASGFTARIRARGLQDRVLRLHGITEGRLAPLYARAHAVIQPSEAEGFGLPVAEALACGGRLLLSDLAVFKEIAGDCARYHRVGDVHALASSILEIPDHPDDAAVRERRSRRASRFRWEHHAKTIFDAYASLPGAVARLATASNA